jgi:flagellar biogenesis protein FliO
MFQKVFLVACLVLLPFSAKAADETVLDTRMDHIKTLVTERHEHQAAAAAEMVKSNGTASDQESGAGLRMVEALLLCLGVFFVGVYFYRKKTGHSPLKRTNRMRVLDRVFVAPKTSLVLAEVDGRQVLLAVGSEQVSFFQAPPTPRTEANQSTDRLIRLSDVTEDTVDDTAEYDPEIEQSSVG